MVCLYAKKRYHELCSLSGASSLGREIQDIPYCPACQSKIPSCHDYSQHGKELEY